MSARVDNDPPRVKSAELSETAGLDATVLTGPVQVTGVTGRVVKILSVVEIVITVVRDEVVMLEEARVDSTLVSTTPDIEARVVVTLRGSTVLTVLLPAVEVVGASRRSPIAATRGGNCLMALVATTGRELPTIDRPGAGS
jgi:hypothetical protein